MDVKTVVQKWVRDIPYSNNEEEQIDLFFKAFETQSASLWDCFALENDYFIQVKFRNIMKEYLIKLVYQEVINIPNKKFWVVKEVVERKG